MNTYRERTLLLGLLSTLLPAHFSEDVSGEEGFRTVLVLEISGREWGWHIADADLFELPVLPWETSAYDGHTTDEKYAAIRALIQEDR